MQILGYILYLLCSLYTLILIVRAIFDMVVVVSYAWRPTGFLLIVANIVYSLTDPPLVFLRRFIPPLRLGAVSLDTSFLVLFVAIQILQRLIVFIF